MKGKTAASLGGAIIVLLVVSFFIYSQINAQNDVSLIQADFVNVLITVLGLEEKLPVAATLSDKVRLLREQGYAPLGDWDLEKLLTKGDVAVILAQILKIVVPPGASVDEYVEALAERGIMTPGDADSIFSLEDLTSTINTAAAIPGAPFVGAGELPEPYHTPVSPTQ